MAAMVKGKNGMVERRLERKLSVQYKSGDIPHPIHNAHTDHDKLVEQVKHYFCHHMKFIKGQNGETPHDWGYEKNGADWDITGTEQSPIDIKATSTAPSVTHYLKMWWNVAPMEVEVHDNGHTLVIEGAVSRLVGTDDERNNSLFEAVQFHFHGPAEHTVDGHRYSLEMHIVHVITAEHFAAQEDEEEELAPKRHLAVLAIFFDVDDSCAPHPFIEDLKLDKAGSGEKVQLNMFNYFSKIERPEYYSYAGSLTTPPCSEIVNWFIVKRPEKITPAQLKYFTSRKEFSEFGNYRVCQPVGTRHVCLGNCDYILDYQYNTGDDKPENLI